MTFIPGMGMLRVAVRYSVLATNLINTLWYYNTGGWNTADAEDLLDSIATVITDDFMPLLSDQVNFMELTGYDMSSETGFVVNRPTSPVEPGAQTDPIASLASCMTVTLQTASRGRSARGRNYLSGFTEASVGGKTFSNTLVSSVDAVYESLRLAGIGVGGTMIVASAQHNGVPLTALAHYQVTSCRANSTIFSQKNRTRS